MPYKAIIFDFFDVIRSDPLQGWLRSLGLKREGSIHEASVAIDRGEIKAPEFFDRLSKATGQPAAEIQIEFDKHTSLNEPLVEIIKGLSQLYKIALLSNAESAYIRAILDEHKLEPLFHHIIISSEVGMVKPSAEIFEHTLSQLAVAPGKALFIDDNPKNVEAATQIGIGGVVYSDVPTLLADLGKLDIKLP